MLPDRLRPLLRAALKHAADARGKSRVVALVASRGFVLELVVVIILVIELVFLFRGK